MQERKGRTKERFLNCDRFSLLYLYLLYEIGKIRLHHTISYSTLNYIHFRQTTYISLYSNRKNQTTRYVRFQLRPNSSISNGSTLMIWEDLSCRTTFKVPLEYNINFTQ